MCTYVWFFPSNVIECSVSFTFFLLWNITKEGCNFWIFTGNTCFWMRRTKYYFYKTARARWFVYVKNHKSWNVKLGGLYTRQQRFGSTILPWNISIFTISQNRFDECCSIFTHTAKQMVLMVVWECRTLDLLMIF